ncbi:MAG: FAD-dependent monooxygenase [Burkholderiales bacterium]|nr:FAD-dependent monooxygenase [Burkholderiales bacterium]
MKIAIIGAGIAGLGLAIGLQRAGIAYSIHERVGHLGQEGLGFILRQNGLDALAQLGQGVVDEVEDAGAWLNHFTLRNPHGKVLLDQPLEGALGIRRAALIQCMMNHVQADSVTMQHQCIGFEYDANGRAIAAKFDDGQQIEANLFVACDGSRSRVRQMLFPDAQLEPVRVHELVSIVHDAEMAAALEGRFLKTQQEEGCLSIGLVPCGGDRVIWYMQFDGTHTLAYDSSEEQRRAFAQKLVGDWADPIPRLLKNSDWRGTHVWRTTDMDGLPTLHKNNIVLLGDAAHPMLTFTSQGVNSALDDAHQFCQLLEQGQPSAETIEAWAQKRLAEIAPMREMGRELAQQFLVFDPNQTRTVPLVD